MPFDYLIRKFMKNSIKNSEKVVVTDNDLVNQVNGKKKEYRGFAKPINSQVDGAIKVLQTLSEPEKQVETVVEPTPEKPSVDVEAINRALEGVNKNLEATNQELKTLKGELVESREELLKTKNELEATRNELEASKKQVNELEKDSKVLKDLGKLQGFPLAATNTPQPLEVLGEGSQEMRNFEKLLEKAPTKVVEASVGYATQKDKRLADEYWQQNKIKISQGVQAILRDKGFLNGGRTTNAITLTTDIPSIAFDHLSNYIRDNTYEDLIHWQFANNNVVDSTEPGLNTSVPRYPYFTRPTTIASRQLSEATPINSGSQNVLQKNTKITIEELGLGKDANNLPVGLTNFVSAFSIEDLEQVIMNNLGMDYQAYNDLRLWSLWFATDVIAYPGFTGNVITNPANLTANDGIFTKEFFIYLRAMMKTLKIKPYQNGLYGFTINPGGLAELLSSISTSERYSLTVSENDVNLVSRALKAAGNASEKQGVVSGYRFSWNGFMFFEQNVYGVGATPGTDAGVTSVTVASTPTTFDSNFAFGANTIAKATALPVEMRESEINDYGRRKNFIWYSHEGYAPLDVKVDANTGSELRVIQVRNKR